MLNIRMESDGEEQDTSRVAPGRTLAANEGAASFGVPVGGSLGSEKQQDETLLAKWAHKERTQNGTVSFKAHLEDEPNVFSSRANLDDIGIQINDGKGRASHAMPQGIQQEKSATAISGRSGLTDIAPKMNINIELGDQQIAVTQG